MSAIDTMPHELCGTLAGLPVYHLLVDDDGYLDAPASPRHLLVGGGSGEHPETSFDIVAAVHHFLLDEELEETTDDPSWGTRLWEFPYERIEALLGRIDPVVPDRDVSIVSTWGGDDWYRFVERARRQEGFGVPYDPAKHRSIESWMASSLGEYALVSMTGLVVSLLPGEVSQEVVALATAVAQRPLYMNVMAFPSGYDHVGGRRERIADGNVRH